MAVEKIAGSLDGTGLRIGVVVSRFNEYAGKEEFEACLQELINLGVDEEDITHVSVPGALEIPFALEHLAESGSFDALIALGAVIRGETYHFEIVSNTSAAGVARVSAECDIPIANGILTTEPAAQCQARTKLKGVDCARCAVEMANLVNVLPESDFDMFDMTDDDDE